MGPDFFQGNTLHVEVLSITLHVMLNFGVSCFERLTLFLTLRRISLNGLFLEHKGDLSTPIFFALASKISTRDDNIAFNQRAANLVNMVCEITNHAAKKI
jgi:hypothetical protein